MSDIQVFIYFQFHLDKFWYFLFHLYTFWYFQFHLYTFWYFQLHLYKFWYFQFHLYKFWYFQFHLYNFDIFNFIYTSFDIFNFIYTSLDIFNFINYIDLILLCLTPLSAIFQLYHNDSFSDGRSWSTRREPPTMSMQLVSFITCGYESSAPFFVIYKAGCEPMPYWW